MPPFVLTARASDPKILVQLARHAAEQDPGAGRRLATMLIRYLEQPWVKSEFDAPTLAELRVDLQQVVQG